MADNIKIQRSALREELWRDGNMARLYLYLLSKVDEPLSFREASKSTGLSLQQVRTAIGKLKSIDVITQIATQKTTQVATQISICGAVGNSKSSTQIATQKTAQVATQDTLVTKDGFERFRDYFNAAVSGTSIPQITKLTDARKNALRSTFREYGKDAVEMVIRKTLASDFLCREWGKVNFDWIFKKANFIKILEGNYDNGSKQSNHASGRYAAERQANRQRVDNGLRAAMDVVARENGF